MAQDGNEEANERRKKTFLPERARSKFWRALINWPGARLKAFPEEIYKNCREYGRIYANLPLEARQFFPLSDNFDDYFAEVSSLLMAITEIPGMAVEKAFRLDGEKPAGQSIEKIFALIDLFLANQKRACSLEEGYKNARLSEFRSHASLLRLIAICKRFWPSPLPFSRMANFDAWRILSPGRTW